MQQDADKNESNEFLEDAQKRAFLECLRRQLGVTGWAPMSSIVENSHSTVNEIFRSCQVGPKDGFGREVTAATGCTADGVRKVIPAATIHSFPKFSRLRRSKKRLSQPNVNFCSLPLQLRKLYSQCSGCDYNVCESRHA